MRLVFAAFFLGLALPALAQNAAPADPPPNAPAADPAVNASPPPATDAPVTAAPASTAPASTAPTARTSDSSAETPPSTDDIFAVGQSLFDQFAPPEIKEQYEFPSKKQWDDFVGDLDRALASDNLADLARYEPEARDALVVLRTLPGGEEYADWLQERLDYIQAAKEVSDAVPGSPDAETPASAQPSAPPAPTPPIAVAPPPATPSAPAPSPHPAPSGPMIPPVSPRPAPPAIAAHQPAVPHYDLWLKRVQDRPAPASAAELMPRLRAAFAAEGVPPQLAWLAEAESTLNPAARSPTGARGLFQMMPDTAQHLGLSTFLPDERTNPEKSAHAAARYLKTLHAKFGTWPLALAAYNAGEGRVARALAAQHGDTFAQIASRLPVETRMYVPKVCALVAVRTGTPANQLPPPSA